MKEYVVLSGKGGTGKTSITASFATLNQNQIVVDCDVDAANLHLLLNPNVESEHVFISGHTAVIDPDKCSQCGLCIDYCRFDAIHYDHTGRVVISEVSCDGCRLCERVCPEQAIYAVPSDKSRWYISNYRNGKLIHARIAPGEENSGKLVRIIRQAAQEEAKIQNQDTLILDGPPGTGCPVISSLSGVHACLIVTEASVSGLHDLKRILELTKQYGVHTQVVINKFDLNVEVTAQIEAYCETVQVPVIGTLAFDSNFVEAMIACKSVCEWAPESDSSKQIKDIYSKFIAS